MLLTADRRRRPLDVERADTLRRSGSSFEEQHGLGLAERFEIGIGRAVVRKAGVVPHRPADLRRQLVVQAVDQIAHVISHVAQVQTFAAAIAGIEDLLQILDRADDHVVVRQRAMTQMVDRADVAVGLHDPAWYHSSEVVPSRENRRPWLKSWNLQAGGKNQTPPRMDRKHSGYRTTARCWQTLAPGGGRVVRCRTTSISSGQPRQAEQQQPRSVTRAIMATTSEKNRAG